MTAQPYMPSPDTGSSEVIHLGGQAPVVVPVTDFLRPRALEQAAAPHELKDAEDIAAMLEWKARDAAGQTTLVSADGASRPTGSTSHPGIDRTWQSLPFRYARNHRAGPYRSPPVRDKRRFLSSKNHNPPPASW